MEKTCTIVPVHEATSKGGFILVTRILTMLIAVAAVFFWDED